jgi:hypothetical protein
MPYKKRQNIDIHLNSIRGIPRSAVHAVPVYCSGQNVSKVTQYTYSNNIKYLIAGWSGVRVPVGVGNYLLTTASRTALGPTHLPIRWVPGALFLGLKRPGREADHSPPYIAKFKERVELHLHSANTPTWRGAQFKKIFKVFSSWQEHGPLSASCSIS